MLKQSQIKQSLLIALHLCSSSLSSFVDNLSEGLYNYKCDDCHSYLNYIKKLKVIINYFLNVLTVKRMIKKTLIKI